MKPYRQQVRTLLSAAIQVVDARTGAVLTSRVKFFFPGVKRQWEPHLTPDGFHVFVGIPVGSHLVRITAPAHQPLDTTIIVPAKPDESNAVLVLPMQPASAPGFR